MLQGLHKFLGVRGFGGSGVSGVPALRSAGACSLDKSKAKQLIMHFWGGEPE